MKKIIIAGGTGFLGKALIDFYKTKVDEIIVFSRGKSHQVDIVNYVQWDAKTLGDWHLHLNNADALINLTGRSVDCRYNQGKQRFNSILTSRFNQYTWQCNEAS